MEKHTRIPANQYFFLLVDDFNELKETRLIVLMAHLYLEYWINEIIFEEPDFIFRDVNLNSFSKKIQILKAKGILKEKESLLKNIEIINKLRNDYAHTLIVSEIDKKMSDRVKEMDMIDLSDAKVAFSSQQDIHSQFKAKVISTILGLLNRMAKKNPK